MKLVVSMRVCWHCWSGILATTSTSQASPHTTARIIIASPKLPNRSNPLKGRVCPEGKMVPKIKSCKC
uniref:Putative secreted protein n=1 Tax=Panstrongylus lignarius TaxID=156445 RepID=A0A224Y1M6_9HEMI